MSRNTFSTIKTVAAILTIMVVGSWFLSTTVRANTATPFEASASTSTNANASLKERIQKVVKENSEKIKGVIDNMSQHKRGFIGQVERITAENVTVQTIKGSEILALTDVQLTKKGESIDPDDVAVGDWMTVLGLEENSTFLPLKIFVSSTSIRPNSYLLELGTVTELATSKLTVATRSDASEISFSLNRSTSYQDLNGNKITAAQLDDEAQVLILGYQDDDGHTATIVRSLTVIVEDEE